MARAQVEAGRYLARHVPDAVCKELAGTSHPIWTGDTGRIAAEAAELLTGIRPPAADAITALCRREGIAEKPLLQLVEGVSESREEAAGR